MNRTDWIERTVMLHYIKFWRELGALNPEDEADRQMVLELVRQLIARHIAPSPDCKEHIGYPGAINDLAGREKRGIKEFGERWPDMSEPSDEQIKEELALIYVFEEEEVERLGVEWRRKFWRCWRAYEAVYDVRAAIEFLLETIRPDEAARRIGEIEQLRALLTEYGEVLPEWLISEIQNALKVYSMNRADWVERTAMFQCSKVRGELRKLNPEDEADRQMVLELVRQLIARHIAPSPDCKDQRGYSRSIRDLAGREKIVSIIDFGSGWPDMSEPSDEQIKEDLESIYGFEEEELARLGVEWRRKFWRCWRVYEAVCGAQEAIKFLLKPLRSNEAARRIEVAGEIEQLRALLTEYDEVLPRDLFFSIDGALKLMKEYQARKTESDERA